MKAIETIYNGHKFRSRLEARWAVFFHTLDIEYRYEFEGFDLDDLYYLPDFYLPQFRCWVEIKPDLPSKLEREKVIRLCLATTQHVYIFSGDMGNSLTRFGFSPFVPPLSMSINEVKEINTMAGGSPTYWLSSDEYITVHSNGEAYWGGDFDRKFIWTSQVAWTECDGCGMIAIVAMGGLRPHGGHRLLFCPNAKMVYESDSERIVNAYTTARQARFEHKKNFH